MFQLSSNFIDRPVLSLRLGLPIAHIYEPIINPNNLRLEAWYAQDLRSKARLVLPYQEIREIIPEGFIVNDTDALETLDALVRIKEIAEIGFKLIGKTVVTDTKQHVGKVTDYAVDTQTFIVQKLYTEQSVLKSLIGGATAIDRSQIIEITNKKIIIRGPEERLYKPARASTAGVPAEAPA